MCIINFYTAPALKWSLLLWWWWLLLLLSLLLLLLLLLLECILEQIRISCFLLIKDFVWAWLPDIQSTDHYHITKVQGNVCFNSCIQNVSNIRWVTFSLKTFSERLQVRHKTYWLAIMVQQRKDTRFHGLLRASPYFRPTCPAQGNLQGTLPKKLEWNWK